MDCSMHFINTATASAVHTVLLCIQTKPVTGLKMSASFNSLYEHVRQLGLPYQIKESGGSINIKISSKIQQHQFSNSREKFRFHTTRTFNGSNNLNWRSSQNFEENSLLSRTTFPDINFFQSTPPPSYAVPPPPPPASACPTASTPATVLSADHDPNQTVNRGEPRTEPIFGNPAKFSSFSFLESIDNSTQPQLQETQSSSVTRTPFFNPLRCSRRKIEYPKTPNLLNPTISAKSPPQVSDVSSEPDLTHPTEIDDPGIKAFKKVMEAVFQRDQFK